MRTLTMLAVLAATALSGSEAVRLDPKWKKDDRTIVRLGITRDESVVTAAFDYKARSVTDSRYEQTATEVENGLPSRAKRKFTKYETKETTTRAKGKHSSKVKKHPLAQRTIELERKQGILVPTIEPPQADPNEPMTAGTDWAWLLPGKAVKVAETWEVGSGWHLGAVHFVLVGNDTECKLERLSGDVAWIRFKAGLHWSGLAKFSRKQGRFTRVELEHLNKGDKTTIRTKFVFDQKVLAKKKN